MEFGLKCLYAITNSTHSFGPFADGWTDMHNDIFVHTKKHTKKVGKKIQLQKNDSRNDDFIKFQWCWTI